MALVAWGLVWGLVWGLLAVGVAAPADLRRLVPLPFVLGGAAGLTAPVLAARRDHRR